MPGRKLRDDRPQRLPERVLPMLHPADPDGVSTAEIAASAELPAAPAPADHCAVPGCQCRPTVRQAVLCEPHARQFRRKPGMSMEQFLADPRVRPLPPSAVLVYDNAKAHRLGRRPPIGEATAALILGQQDRVRTRFPHTPAGELKLLPPRAATPTGTGRSASTPWT